MDEHGDAASVVIADDAVKGPLIRSARYCRPMSEQGAMQAGAGPGWYTDPRHPPRQWYWDGTAWTGESRDQPVLPPPPMRCVYCGRTSQFQPASYMLNTQGLTLLGWDGFNRVAHCQICTSCGFIHWFAPPP